MIGINDSSMFVVYCWQHSRTLHARQKQIKKQFFLSEFENKRILEITSPQKSKTKNKKKSQTEKFGLRDLK